MSDANSPRPRLVSVSDDPADEAGGSPAAEAPGSAAGKAPRRLLWVLAVLVIAAVVGLVAQTLRTRTLQAENEALVGELFATRSALDAYVARFAEVRDSIEGLQAQLTELDSLVSEDPLARVVPETGAETGAADVPGD
jgi:uncharacterized protein HemX